MQILGDRVVDNKITYNEIIKANNKLIAKIDELIDFLMETVRVTKLDYKESKKYERIEENEKAKIFKKDCDNKEQSLKEKLAYTVKNLKEDEKSAFISSLVNYFAKVENGYYDILAITKKENMSASSLYKCYVMLNYYKNNLQFINNLHADFEKIAHENLF